MKKAMAYIRLTRPANIVTAVADILAGFAVSGAAMALFSPEIGIPVLPWTLFWLCLATIGLYGGGVAFNDVFDADLDRVERPERPIPSGKVSVTNAAIMASSLLLLGVLTAWQVSALSGTIALIVAVLSLLYNSWGKHQLILGPINMGLCRSGNLLLGVSAVPAMVGEVWYLGFIPLVYIAAITMVSRGEVHGRNKKALQGGLAMYGFIVVAVFWIALHNGGWWQVFPFLILLCYLIFPPLVKALRTQQPQMIGKAVKMGVISLIILNACLASAYAGWMSGLIVSLLLPLSLWIAKKFAVT